MTFSRPAKMIVTLLGVAVLIGTDSWSWGQAGGAKAKPKGKNTGPNAKALDVKFGQVTQQFVKDFQDLARDYEDAGQYESAKTLWEVLLKLNPKYPGAEEKVKQLSEKMLEATEFEVEVDVSEDWKGPVAAVVKDRQYRIEATGEFKVVTSSTATADGVNLDPNGRDFVPGIPLGALMGILVGTDGKPGKPFRIGTKFEEQARNNGLLLLKVNAPRDHKSTGTLTVKLSGVGKVAAR